MLREELAEGHARATTMEAELARLQRAEVEAAAQRKAWLVRDGAMREELRRVNERCSALVAEAQPEGQAVQPQEQQELASQLRRREVPSLLAVSLAPCSAYALVDGGWHSPAPKAPAPRACSP